MAHPRDRWQHAGSPIAGCRGEPGPGPGWPAFFGKVRVAGHRDQRGHDLSRSSRNAASTIASAWLLAVAASSLLWIFPVRIGRAGGVHRAFRRSSSVRKAVCPRWRPREGKRSCTSSTTWRRQRTTTNCESRRGITCAAGHMLPIVRETGALWFPDSRSCARAARPGRIRWNRELRDDCPHRSVNRAGPGRP